MKKQIETGEQARQQTAGDSAAVVVCAVDVYCARSAVAISDLHTKCAADRPAALVSGEPSDKFCIRGHDTPGRTLHLGSGIRRGQHLGVMGLLRFSNCTAN